MVSVEAHNQKPIDPSTLSIVTGRSVRLRLGSVRALPTLPRICRGASISSVAGRLGEFDSEVLSKG